MRFAASAGEKPSRISPFLCSAKVTTEGSFVCRITSSAISASPSQEMVSAMMKSTPASIAQATCSSYMARTWRAASASPGL